MRTLRSCTKADLIAALDELDDDDMVVFASDYGDRTHTQQIHTLEGEVTQVRYRESAYSGSGFAVKDEHDEDDDGNDLPEVWVLS